MLQNLLRTHTRPSDPDGASRPTGNCRPVARSASSNETTAATHSLKLALGGRGLRSGFALRFRRNHSSRPAPLPAAMITGQHAGHIAALLSLLLRGPLFCLWQTPDLFDLAESGQHLFVLLADCRLLRQVERLDHVSMRAGHDHERIHAAKAPAADVLGGNTRGVVHEMRVVHGDD